MLVLVRQTPLVRLRFLGGRRGACGGGDAHLGGLSESPMGRLPRPSRSVLLLPDRISPYDDTGFGRYRARRRRGLDRHLSGV